MSASHPIRFHHPDDVFDVAPETLPRSGHAQAGPEQIPVRATKADPEPGCAYGCTGAEVYPYHLPGFQQYVILLQALQDRACEELRVAAQRPAAFPEPADSDEEQ